jgi:hypothetical protein
MLSVATGICRGDAQVWKHGSQNMKQELTHLSAAPREGPGNVIRNKYIVETSQTKSSQPVARVHFCITFFTMEKVTA